MPQVYSVGVEGRPGNESFVLRTVEPIPSQGMSYFGHMQPQLMGAACAGHKAQQGQAVSLRQHLIVCMGWCTLWVNVPLEQRVTVSVDGQVNVP